MRSLPAPTPSLLLRHFVPDDAARLLQLNAEPTTRHWIPSHVYRDLAEAHDAVAFLIRCYTTPGDARHGPYVLGVAVRTTNRLLGHVGFSPRDNGEVEVSYAIAEDARGRGHATEALDAACRWAMATFELLQLVAITASANAPSRRLLERVGFAHAGDGVQRFQGADDQAVSRYVRVAPR